MAADGEFEIQHMVGFAKCLVDRPVLALKHHGLHRRKVQGFYVDDDKLGNGSRIKFVANLLVAVHTLAAAEAHQLGSACGLDPDLVQEVIAAGVGSSAMFEIRGPMMAAGTYEPPSARLAIILKDAGIIADHARSLGASTPLLDAALPLYQAAVDAGLGDLDAAALRRLLGDLS